jgi:hypothetical protein
MPLLLIESLDPVRRETTHQHIESCGVCGDEWTAYQETWAVMGDLPEIEVPSVPALLRSLRKSKRRNATTSCRS